MYINVTSQIIFTKYIPYAIMFITYIFKRVKKMNNNSKKYLIGTFVSIALMFVWIFLTVFLTGGKEIEDFSVADQYIFSGFIVAEIITFVSMFVFASKLGKENYKRRQLIKPMPKTKQEISQNKKSAVLGISAYIIALGAMCIGIIVIGDKPELPLTAFKAALAVCSIMPAIFIFLNAFFKKRFLQRIEQKGVGEFQQYIISHRELAEEASAEKLSLSKNLRIFTDIYSVLLSVLAIVISFCAGILFDTDLSVPFCLYSAFLILTSLSRIRFRTPATIFDEDETYISEKEYPEIYKTLQKAADTLGCKGKIKLAVIPDCNAGIAKISDVYSVQIGAILLNILSEEELYNVLLHEFAHIKNNSDYYSTKNGSYFTWIQNGGNPHFLSGLSSLLFCCFDTVYCFHYNLYIYASSILNESQADKTMAYYGNSEIAASALLKMKYFELYTWEKGTYDTVCPFEKEEPDKRYLTDELDEFKKAVNTRFCMWNNLAESEILSRSASHPTLKMRLEVLGVTRMQTVESADTENYKTECAKYLNYVEELIHKERLKTYYEYRKEYYIEPKKKIDLWLADGKPVIAEEYADIHTALRQLGRNREAYDLCDRAIAELPTVAKCFACFAKGCYLLHCYDKTGIDYIYTAIENNPNYIDEGLDVIGGFCCLTGLQQELDVYREKAIELCQKAKDKYSQINQLNKTDNLSTEQLPDGMLNSILDYIKAIDSNCIDKIYLIRKTISDDFFTSAFVIKFDDGTNNDTKDNVLHKIFCHLDTCSDWQFSLFDYTSVAAVKVENIENSCVYSKR